MQLHARRVASASNEARALLLVVPKTASSLDSALASWPQTDTPLLCATARRTEDGALRPELLVRLVSTPARRSILAPPLH